VGLYSGGGAYIWNDVSVSTCGGLIHGGGVIFGGACSWRFTVRYQSEIAFDWSQLVLTGHNWY
jgi:hypothetical protein